MTISDTIVDCHEQDVPNRPPLLGARDPRGLRALREEGLFDHYLLASMEPVPRVVDGIRILPWSDFLDRLWGGEWL